MDDPSQHRYLQWVGGMIEQDISQPEGLRAHLKGYLAATDGSVILRVEGGEHWIIIDKVLSDGRIVVRDAGEAFSTLVTPRQLSDMRPTGDAVFSFPEETK